LKNSRNIAYLLIAINVRVFSIEMLSSYHKFPVIRNHENNRISLNNFSREGNVVHIVLDGFQGGLFKHLIEGNGEMKDSFAGYTFFDDAITSSDITYLSVPSILAGDSFKNARFISEYLMETGVSKLPDNKQGAKPVNLLQALANAGYEVDVATPLWIMKEQEYYKNYYYIKTPYVTDEVYIRQKVLLSLDIAIFRYTPEPLKSFVYNNGAWLVSSYDKSITDLMFSHFSHIRFLEDVAENMFVSDRDKTYKFFHLITPHGPWVTGSNCSFAGRELDQSLENISNQAKCVVATVINFLSKLRDLDLYDNSTIIVHGDHGIGLDLGLNTDAKDNVNLPSVPGNVQPLLMVKPANSTGPLEFSDEQVQLSDIPKTMMNLLGIENIFDGYDMFDMPEDPRTRYFFTSIMHRNKAAEQDYFDNFTRYSVRGSLKDISSWHLDYEKARTIADAEFEHHEFTEVVSSGVNKKNEMWISVSQTKPWYYITLDGEKMRTVIHDNVLTLKLPRSLEEIGDICIVDPKNRKKQCL